jgi:hypothetical protein
MGAQALKQDIDHGETQYSGVKVTEFGHLLTQFSSLRA